MESYEMFKLKDFQKEALREMLKFSSTRNEGWFLLKSPTGTGKTYIGLIYLYKIYLKNPDLDFFFLGWSRVGIFQAQKVLNELLSYNLISKDFAKILTINTIQSQCLGKIESVVVVDEAHHLTEEGEYRNYLKKSTTKFLIGLSGTPRVTYREDGFAFAYLIERSEIFIALPAHYKTTLDIPVKETLADIGIGKNHFEDGDTTHTFLEYLGGAKLTDTTKSQYKLQMISKVLLEEVKALGKCIVFVRSVAEAQMLAQYLKNSGALALQVDGNTSDSHLDTFLNIFQNQQNCFLIGDKMINESLDIKGVNTIVLADQTSSDMLYSQWLGRGSRMSDEKIRNKFRLIDFRENYKAYNSKEQDGGFYKGASRRSFAFCVSSDGGAEVKRYKANIDFFKLCMLIKDQNEYFGIKRDAVDRELTEAEISSYILLLCMPGKEKDPGLSPIYDLLDSTYSEQEIFNRIVNANQSAPLEVPFVKYFVKPMVDYVFGQSIIEETLESMDRIDMYIPKSNTLIEFGIGKADEKYEQILRYAKQVKASKYIIVGTSFQGSTFSREIDSSKKVEFINWFDFFQMLSERVILSDLDIEKRVA